MKSVQQRFQFPVRHLALFVGCLANGVGPKVVGKDGRKFDKFSQLEATSQVEVGIAATFEIRAAHVPCAGEKAYAGNLIFRLATIAPHQSEEFVERRQSVIDGDGFRSSLKFGGTYVGVLHIRAVAPAGRTHGLGFIAFAKIETAIETLHRLLRHNS
ncbi:MAG: hypothetical protein ACYDDI_14870 [Candidatus Acidiferrales bacterium]